MFDGTLNSNVTKYADYTYWFRRKTSTEWYAYALKLDSNGSYVVDETSNTVVHADLEGLNPSVDCQILSDFDKFKSTRLEYLVGKPISETVITQPEDAQQMYDNLLVGAAFIRAERNGRDPDDFLDRIAHCLKWLHSTDFYTAPASTVYHGAFPGGLITHSLEVVNEIIALHSVPKFNSVRIEDAILVALVHDWCKIGLYEQYMRNVKNEETGVWEKVPAYKRKNALVPLGHGVASMLLAQRFFKLSIDEALAIRWHMGEYNVASNEMNELHAANESVPLVQLLQFADRLSITKY